MWRIIKTSDFYFRSRKTFTFWCKEASDCYYTFSSSITNFRRFLMYYFSNIIYIKTIDVDYQITDKFLFEIIWIFVLLHANLKLWYHDICVMKNIWFMLNCFANEKILFRIHYNINFYYEVAHFSNSYCCILNNKYHLFCRS